MITGLLILAACGWAGWVMSLLDIARLRKSLLAELEADDAIARESDANHKTVLAALSLINERREEARVCGCWSCTAGRLVAGRGSN